MYFDEADTLTKTFAPQFIKTRYDVLCSVLYVFKKQPVFGIFLSTAMRLAPQPAPTGRLAPSARIPIEIKLIQAPITETPFDCSPDLPVDPNSLTLDQISKISFMARFGRPLYVLCLIPYQCIILELELELELNFVDAGFGP